MDLEELKNSISVDVQHKTVKVLEHLCSIWHGCYSKETIVEHITKFPAHVAELFSDIVEDAESTREIYTAQLEQLLKEIGDVCEVLTEPLPAEVYQKLPVSIAVSVLKEKLESLREELDERSEIVTALLAKESELCNDLGLRCKGLPESPLPSKGDIEAFQRYLSNMESMRSQRNEELQKIRDDLARLFEELEIRPSLESEATLLSGTKIKVTEANLKHFTSIHAEYLERLERSKATVMELRDKLSQLWERLEEDPIIRSEFLRKHQGHGDKTSMALRKEISKCEERKRNNIKVFIEKMRHEIEHWWKECMMSESEKAEFTCMDSDCYTEDSLTLHEMYVEKLQEFYLSNEKIFGLLKERSELWSKLSDLETLANEPNRYNNRGGKLLREEKERKKIAAQLPKVENQLILLSQDYTKRTNKLFTVYGEHIEDLIENKRMEHKIDKQSQLSARKQARSVVTPKSATPSSRTRLFANTKSGIDAFGPTFSTTPSKVNLLSTPKLRSKRTPKLNVENMDPRQNMTPSTYGQVSTAQKKILSVNKTGSAIKRRSGQNDINTKIQKKLKKATPEILNASKSYANFKTHLAKNPKLRSSIAPTKRNKSTLVSSKPKIVVSAPTPPAGLASKMGTTLKKATTIIRQNTLTEPIYPNKTPKLTRSSSVMSPSCLSSKLSTKNLPIII